jgi:hypothetical protein
MKTSTSMDKQRIHTFNIAMVMAALASMIGISLLSLSVYTIMINAQASSSSPTSGGISSGSGTGSTRMGICVIGVESSCNGHSNLGG